MQEETRHQGAAPQDAEWLRRSVCSLQKGFTAKQTLIDHITPISEGGHATDPKNLQVVCKTCNFEKTKNEQETGYLKISDTASSFNVKTTETCDSGLCAAHAFVETTNVEAPRKMADYQVHYMDTNKSRKNDLFYSKHCDPFSR